MLSRAQVRTLALWSYAATFTQHLASTTCAYFLARLFECSVGTMRQRLREFYWEAQQKRGKQRRTLEVAPCFAPLLRWILSLYRTSSRSERDLVLALDASLCRNRLALLSISVVFRGSALPVAWKIFRANEKGSWISAAIELLTYLQPAIPPTWRVIVLCDRGLQSQKLFRAMVTRGFHPMIRLTRLGLWRPAGQQPWYRLAALLPGPGCYYLGEGELFKTKPLSCTLVALWEEGYEAPWLLMTDLKPAQCCGAFYGLRSWIEQGFRVMKSGAYHCERLRVSDPKRAERIWLVLAVSLMWTHAVGATVQREEEPCRLSSLFYDGVRRVLGVHRKGYVEILVCALRGDDLPWPVCLFAAPHPCWPPDLYLVHDLPP